MTNASLQRSRQNDMRRRMTTPHRQSVAQNSAGLGVHVVTLYSWRKAWRLQGKVIPGC